MAVVVATAAGIDMNKVLATEKTIDSITDGRLAPDEAQTALAKIAGLPPVSLGRFALAAAVGASALSVVFGAAHPASIWSTLPQRAPGSRPRPSCSRVLEDCLRNLGDRGDFRGPATGSMARPPDATCFPAFAIRRTAGRRHRRLSCGQCHRPLLFHGVALSSDFHRCGNGCAWPTL